ncbi:FAD-dependent oxidoreductase [Arthrobacter sp. Rue61a]|uniref:NAD(P)/FAD-dependent oxidoreductase n=1 Tax=Arthrobacter sp. Rue61a TaxID=1118963 RepID=UPI00027DFD29|nr:FAD-dependent oxidoreductase [Arthrobacter sp. Rue61a]AFR28738.1 putative ferredoxin reductase / NAD(FAD)-dependent dehydrogenase [Arthrobacter sp. Rue61a]
MSKLDQDVMIVGASAAGLSTAEALRRGGHRGRLTLLDAESRDPYDRPPLSKQVLSGQWEASQTALRSREALDTLGAEWILGERAEHLETGARSVRTATGRILSADAIVLATGVTPRYLPGQESLKNAHVVRTIDDALGLKPRLRKGRRLVVVGNGVLGSEVAATAAALGVDVILVGASPTPMAAQLGDYVSAMLADMHEKAGVRLLGGRRVTGVRRGWTGAHVTLDGGEVLSADDVVVAIGSRPATDWLAYSGLQLDDGIVCDSFCRAAPGIWAAGDAARWDHSELGSIRLENRTNAAEQALAVAADILGAGAPYAPIPYFWTDQHNVRIQVHGSVANNARLRITDGDPATGRFVAFAFSPDHERPVGVIGWAMPKQTRMRRAELQTAVAPTH